MNDREFVGELDTSLADTPSSKHRWKQRQILKRRPIAAFALATVAICVYLIYRPSVSDHDRAERFAREACGENVLRPYDKPRWESVIAASKAANLDVKYVQLADAYAARYVLFDISNSISPGDEFKIEGLVSPSKLSNAFVTTVRFCAALR